MDVFTIEMSGNIIDSAVLNEKHEGERCSAMEVGYALDGVGHCRWELDARWCRLGGERRR